MTNARRFAIRSVIALVAFAVAIATTSCLLTSSLDDYDSAYGRTDGATSNDAASEGGGARDASGDGAACDAGFCACNGAAHDFCADFDTPPPITGWEIQQGGATTLEFVEAGAISPPTSLHVRFPPMQSANGRANLELLDHRTPTKLRVEMDMAIDEADTVPGHNNGTHGACPMSIEFATGTVIRVDLYADAIDVEQLVGGSTAEVTLGSIPTAAGTRGRIGLWLDFDTKKCGLTFDGVEQLPACALDVGFKSGPAHIDLGLVFVRPPTAAWGIRADNVTVDYR